MTAAATKERASNFHVHSEDAHFTAVPDNTNSPGSQEPRISKTESTAHVSDLTSDKFCRFRPIVQNSVLPRYGSPAIKHIASYCTCPNFTFFYLTQDSYQKLYLGQQIKYQAYTCQLFLRYRREIFILGVLRFLKTTRSFPKIPEEARSLPKTSEVSRRRLKSSEDVRSLLKLSYRENA